MPPPAERGSAARQIVSGTYICKNSRPTGDGKTLESVASSIMMARAGLHERAIRNEKGGFAN